MKPASRIPLALLTGTFAVALLTTTARSDVIMDWNAKADAIAIEKQIANAANARGQAMLHVAMFEAVNAIDRRYAPYKLNLAADHGTSREAAAASAAHDVLLALYPDQKPDLDATLATALAAITDPDAKSKGIELGRKAAAGIIALRADDGTNAPESYRPVTAPGVYVPTATPIESTSGKMTPWAMSTGAQFLPAPPPALNSEVWTRDLNEIREIGSSASTKRSAEQTTMARFWFFTGPRTYNPIVKQVALAKKMDIADCARLYALSSIAGADAFTAVFDSKYTYSQSLASGDGDPQCRSDVQSGDAAGSFMAAARHYPDASGISLCALHRLQCHCHGTAARRWQRGWRDCPGKPDGARRYTQVDTAAGL